MNAAAAATRTGTPGGAMGVKTRVIIAANTATMIGRLFPDACSGNSSGNSRLR
jgi:hypothetical protein